MNNIKSKCFIREDGTKEWYLNGNLHREDGPAVEYTNGYKAWFINGKRHREDGPAIEWADGDKEWWLNGVKYSETEFNQPITSKTQSESTQSINKSSNNNDENKRWQSGKQLLNF